jgi:hypothetical protein
MEEQDFSLEALVGLFHSAVTAIVVKGNAPVEEYAVLPEVSAFREVWAWQRYLGAIALNHFNMVMATKAVRQNPGSKLKTYVRLDAEWSDGIESIPKTASVIVNLDDLKPHIPIEAEQFVNFDDPMVQEGIRAYLRENPLWHSNRIFSHLDENLTADNRAACGSGFADFSPLSTIRMVVPDVDESGRRGTEESIVETFAKRLSEESIIGRQYKLKNVKEDLEALLGVGKGYPNLYSVFEQTRFFATNIIDALTVADKYKPAVLTLLEKNSNGNQQQDKIRKNVIKLLEDIIAAKIKVPYEVLECGVKGLPSFAKKVLRNSMQEYGVIDPESMNNYLKQHGQLSIEEKDLHERDLRDLFRMSWIIHGSSVSYDLRSGHLAIPELELQALSKVYDIFLKLAEIPEELRGFIEHVDEAGERKRIPGWRTENVRKTSTGLTIDPSSERDVKDYIKNSKKNGFAQLKVYGRYDYGPYDESGAGIPLEIQLMTNFMHTFNQLDRASHDAFKEKERVIQAFLMETRPWHAARVVATEQLVQAVMYEQPSPVSPSARS